MVSSGALVAVGRGAAVAVDAASVRGVAARSPSASGESEPQAMRTTGSARARTMPSRVSHLVVPELVIIVTSYLLSPGLYGQ